MSQSIALGLGDIFITRLVFDCNNLSEETVRVNSYVIEFYREKEHYDKNMKFVKYLLEKLFHDRYVIFRDCSLNIVNYYVNHRLSDSCKDIKQYFNTDSVLDEKYIIFHTKARCDNHDQTVSLETYNAILSQLAEFCSSFKCKYKILIMGGRKVENNTETSLHPHTSIFSLYDQVCKLKNNNIVHDCTRDELYDIDAFEYDMRLLANAEHVVGVGWGGNFAITWGVTANFLFYMPPYLIHPIVSHFSENQIHRKLPSFFTSINNACGSEI